VAVVPGPDTKGLILHQQGVIIARAAEAEPAADTRRHWVLITHGDPVVDRLAASIAQRGHACTVIAPTDEASVRDQIDRVANDLHAVIHVAALPREADEAVSVVE